MSATSPDSTPVAILRQKPTVILLAVMLLLLAARLLVWGLVVGRDSEFFIANDSPGYYDPARTLIELGKFSVDLAHPDTPMTLRTPGYSVFIAGAYLVLGQQPENAVLVQVFFSVLSVSLVYGLARLLWGNAVALWAAVLFALDIVSFGYSMFVLTETLFTLFILVMLLGGVLFLRHEGDTRYALLTGLALSIATLIRPTPYYLIVLLVPGALLWGFRQHWNWKKQGTVALALLLPFLVLVGGWQLRNQRLTGHSDLSQIEGLNMLFHRGAGVIALRDGITIEEARQQIMDEDYKEMRIRALLNPEEGWGARWRKEGLDIIRQHPLVFLRVETEGLVRLFITPGHETLASALGYPTETTGPLGDLRRLSPGDYVDKWLVQNPVHFLLCGYAIFYLLVIYLGNTLWFWYHFRARKFHWEQLYLWGVLIYLTVLSAGPEANHRFRIPVMPILVLFAAQGWYQLWQARQSRPVSIE